MFLELLGNCIEVYGDWIPRHIFGLFHALMSIFRMFWACLRLIWSDRHFDIIFLDQVSYVIPLLKFSSNCDKIVFYCHHPDLLLSSRKDISLLKQMYRFFLDRFEEITTASCDELLVNSEFTKSVVLKTFPILNDLDYLKPKVVYPAIDTTQFKKVKLFNFEKQKRITFLSINRYERKKEIDMAIKALKKLYKQMEVLSKNDKISTKNVKLIIAGGYDERLAENREYLNELIDLCKKLELNYQFITQPAFEPQKPKKSKQDYANNNNNTAASNDDDEDNEDDDDDGAVQTNSNNNTNTGGKGRRQSISEKVTGIISDTIAAATGSGSKNDDDDDEDETDSDDEYSDDEFEEKQSTSGKKIKRRESSRRTHIDFLDNRKLKIDKHANVYFITKFPDQQKFELLSESLCVLYTPQNEHFGIVPLEGMNEIYFVLMLM